MSGSDDLMELGERVRRLERRYHVMLVLMTVICVLLILCWPRLFGRRIVVQEVVLKAPAGQLRAIMGIDRFDDAPYLKFLDRDGRVRINMGLSEHSTPGLGFVYEKGDAMRILPRETFKTVMGSPETVTAEGQPATD